MQQRETYLLSKNIFVLQEIRQEQNHTLYYSFLFNRVTYTNLGATFLVLKRVTKPHPKTRQRDISGKKTEGTAMQDAAIMANSASKILARTSVLNTFN